MALCLDFGPLLGSRTSRAGPPTSRRECLRVRFGIFSEETRPPQRFFPMPYEGSVLPHIRNITPGRSSFSPAPPAQTVSFFDIQPGPSQPGLFVYAEWCSPSSRKATFLTLDHLALGSPALLSFPPTSWWRVFWPTFIDVLLSALFFGVFSRTSQCLSATLHPLQDLDRDPLPTPQLVAATSPFLHPHPRLSSPHTRPPPQHRGPPRGVSGGGLLPNDSPAVTPSRLWEWWRFLFPYFLFARFLCVFFPGRVVQLPVIAFFLRCSQIVPPFFINRSPPPSLPIWEASLFVFSLAMNSSRTLLALSSGPFILFLSFLDLRRGWETFPLSYCRM